MSVGGGVDGAERRVVFGYASREGTTATNSGLAVANSAGATSLQWNLSGGGSVIVNSINPIREGDHSTTNTNDHPQGGRSSYIGGYIYRGPIAELQGKYFYADFVNSNIFMLDGIDRNMPLSSYSGTNFNQNANFWRRWYANSGDFRISSLWNTLIFDPKNRITPRPWVRPLASAGWFRLAKTIPATCTSSILAARAAITVSAPIIPTPAPAKSSSWSPFRNRQHSP